MDGNRNSFYENIKDFLSDRHVEWDQIKLKLAGVHAVPSPCESGCMPPTATLRSRNMGKENNLEGALPKESELNPLILPL